MQCTRPFILGDVQTPCGKCESCLAQRSREWSVRLTHHYMFNPDAFFLTLTYSDDFLSDITVDEHQRFMKRLRKEYAGKITYYMCAHYGEKSWRPHYHYLIFGIPAKDLEIYKIYDFSRSVLIDKVWKLGHNCVGTVTPESINYVTGYIKKKRNLPRELKKKCFSKQSQGIGITYAIKNADKFFNFDFKIKGHKVTIPRYYIKKLGIEMQESHYEELNAINAIKLQERDEHCYYTNLDYKKGIVEVNNQRELNQEAKRKIYENKL